MATTVSHLAQSVQGNQRVRIMKVIFGSASATAEVPTQLNRVSYAVVNRLNGAANPSLRLNATAAGTALAGNIGLLSGTSAGSYVIAAYGPNT